MFDVTEDIKYIGCDDTTLDLFEGQYPVPNGVSYNSYICFDEKIAVFDTVDSRKTDEWLHNSAVALGGKKPDYIIISHVEPDHSASLPAFIKKYPSAAVVGNKKTFEYITKFYGDIVKNPVTVDNGGELSLGKHVLKFLFAPMVHWPEVMLTYDACSGVLFSADGFGKFGALCCKEDWTDEARRYYINIVGKYGAPVQNVLRAASSLNIKTICPLHGPVLKDNLQYYLNKYDTWSSYKSEEDGVLIAYASVYGHTAEAANKLRDKLAERGIKAETVDLGRCDASYAVASAFRYSKTVIASITYDGAVMPCVQAFINRLKSKGFCNRKVGFIQNGSWAPLSAKLMRVALEDCKNITFCNTVVTVNSAADSETQSEICALAAELE